MITLSWEEKTIPHRSNKNHFTNKSVRGVTQQSFTSNMDQNLGEQRSQVGGRTLFVYPGYSGGHSFSKIMVENNYVILIQC